MKTNIKTAGLVLLLVLACNTSNAETTAVGKILPYPIYQHKLDNGLNVVTVPFDSPGLASFHIVTRVGARNEVEPGVTGFLVDSTDKWQEALLRLASDAELRKKMGELGSKRAVEHFSTTATFARMQATLHEALPQ